MLCDEDCRTAVFGKTERTVGWEGDGDPVMMGLLRHCNWRNPQSTDRPCLTSLTHSFTLDCNIFVKTPKAAERVMESVCRYIEKRLKLVVNQEKSQVACSDRVKFLGMTIVGQTIAISHKALQTAMAKVKELTPRGTHQKLEKTLEEINSWYVGWAGYFGMTYYPAQLKKIEAHIRRRLRSRLVDQQKSKRNLYRKLVKRGVTRRLAAKTVFSNRKRWALSHTIAASKAYPVGWFTGDMGQAIRSDRELPHWFGLNHWINLA